MALQPFARVEELQAALQRDDLPAATATLALTRASAAVRSECHWNLTQETVIDAQPNTGRGRNVLFLPTLYLVTVDSVTEGGLTLTAGTHYTWERHGVVYRNGCWPVQVNAVTLTYTHGYPDDHPNLGVAKDVCLAVAIRMVSNPYRHSAEATGTESWSVGIQTAQSSLTDGEKAQLAPFALDTP